MHYQLLEAKTQVYSSESWFYKLSLIEPHSELVMSYLVQAVIPES